MNVFKRPRATVVTNKSDIVKFNYGTGFETKSYQCLLADQVLSWYVVIIYFRLATSVPRLNKQVMGITGMITKEKLS